MAAPKLVSDLLKDTAPPVEQEKKFVERSISLTAEDVFCPFDGQRRSCTVTSTIPGLDERQRMTRILAALTANTPWDALSVEDREYYTMLSVVGVQCTDMPAWFQRVLQEDMRLLIAVYQQCAEHTARYLRGVRGEGDSDAEVPAFRLSSSLPVLAPAKQE
jgi:hypothetical protein